MCELFAMSSRYPVTVALSFDEFSRRGGDTGPHKDGWGIAYYMGRDVRLVKEAEPASDSACVRLIEGLGLHSTTVLSHIRKATHGEPALHNTQPFARELGGRMHVFAHNGDLKRGYEALRPRRFQAIGDTDSEHVFCALLDRLAPLWGVGEPMPSLEQRMAVVVEFAAQLREMGSANFLYADGDVLFVHAHKRRQADSSEEKPPGLHMLCRTCHAEDDPSLVSPGIRVTGAAGQTQRVILLGSVPLTDEPWEPLPGGTVLALRDGQLLARRSGEVGAEQQVD